MLAYTAKQETPKCTKAFFTVWSEALHQRGSEGFAHHETNQSTPSLLAPIYKPLFYLATISYF
jgi:hypothetical protein